MKKFAVLPLLGAILLAGASLSLAQSGGDRAPGKLRSEQKADLRRDVQEEQTKRAEELNLVRPLPRMTPYERAELRRQLQEQDEGNPPSGRSRKRP